MCGFGPTIPPRTGSLMVARTPTIFATTLTVASFRKSGQNRHWIAFISQGRGAGQYREVKAQENYSYYAKKLTVDRPWRIIPDSTSRINLLPAYRDIAIYHNSIDGGVGDPTHKIHGPTFYFEAFGNHVAKNTIRNVTAGIIFASRYRCPTAWNFALDNKIEDIVDGYTGDTATEPVALNDQFYQTETAWPPLNDPVNYSIGQVWYTVGNVFRGTRARTRSTARPSVFVTPEGRAQIRPLRSITPTPV